MFGGGGDQAPEVLAAAQLRVNGVMTALGAADGIGAAGVAGLGAQGIVAALAKLRADRVNRREVQHVETHVADHRQAFVHVVEGAVAFRAVGDRAREQLVPAGELRRRAVHVDREFAAAGQVRAVLGFAHQARGLRPQQQRHLLVGRQARQARLQRLDRAAQFPFAALGTLAQQQPALFQLELDLDAGIELLLQVMAVGGERVDPCSMLNRCGPSSSGVNSASHRSLPGECIGTQCQRRLWAWRQLSMTARRSCPSL